MGNCWSDSKITAERFEIEKQVLPFRINRAVRSYFGPQVFKRVLGRGSAEALGQKKEEKHQERLGRGG